MFKPNPKITQAREQLLEFLQSKHRGDLVTHEQIEALIGFSPPANAYYDVIAWAKKHLERSRGIALLSITGTGYSLAVPDKQLELLPLRTKKARNHVRKGLTSVEVLPADELTDHQRRIQDAYQQVGAAAIDALQKSKARQEFLMRPRPEPVPVRLLDDPHT